MLLQQLLAWLTEDNVSADQLLVESDGIGHWTINWDRIPNRSHIQFLWKQYLWLSTSTPTRTRSRNQPFRGSVHNGVQSEAESSRTPDSDIADHLHTLPIFANLWNCRYQPICIAWAKLFWPSPNQGLKPSHSFIESAETVWISYSLTQSGRVRVSLDGWSMVVRSNQNKTYQNLLTADIYCLLLQLEYSDLYQNSLALFLLLKMDTNTIVYPAGRTLQQIRIVKNNLRNTNELQLYLPRKTMEKELSATQLMSMTEQIIKHIGVTMTTGDKHKLQVALEYTVREKVVQAFISGGFSTATILHLKIRIDPIGVSTNGTLPNTIPFAMRVPVYVDTATKAIGADGNKGSTGQSTALTIVQSFKAMEVAEKKGQ